MFVIIYWTQLWRECFKIYFNIKGLKSVYGINQLGIVLSNVSTASLLKIVLPLDTYMTRYL